MHDVMRKRILRKLESLPEDRLYQVLDYIDFLESKYAPEHTPRPSVVQRFGERLEDGMRALSMGPKAVTGTMNLVGAAGRVFEGLSEAGKDLMRGIEEASAPTARRSSPGGSPARRAADAEGAAPPRGAEAVPRGTEPPPEAAEPEEEPPPEAGQPRRPDANLGTEPDSEG